MASKSMILRNIILLLHMILGKSLPKTRHSHVTQTKLFKYHHHHFLPADLDTTTMVCDFEGTLLQSSSTFPYFMLVALEAGSFLRGLLLLIIYPFACLLGKEKGLELMVMVSFFGIRANGSKIGRAVLPKHLSEAMGMEGFEFVMGINNRGGKRRSVVCVSEMPKVMVEEFVKEYLGVEMVVGRKLKEKIGYYTGFMEEECEHDYSWRKELFGDGEDVVGVIGGGSRKWLEHPIFTKCKRIYTISEDKKRSWHGLPRLHNHRKPVVFHDGRIAFRPTPLASLAMFIWLPFGFLLANFRIIIFIFLPYKLSIPCLALTGMKSRLIDNNNNNNTRSSIINKIIIPTTTTTSSKHNVYVCNHKTLLDPIYVSAALRKPVTAVTYSLSRLSEVLSPIKTIRLTRDKEEDKKRMETQIKKGYHVVVCPEGTTCREPFLLRFSPLFTELNKEVVPVAVDASVGMFHGTTAAGFKCMDPFFFLINPCPFYSVEFLDKISMTSRSDRFEVANFVQAQIGRALGFECTNFTRKDKYLKLAGNEGVVK